VIRQDLKLLKRPRNSQVDEQSSLRSRRGDDTNINVTGSARHALAPNAVMFRLFGTGRDNIKIKYRSQDWLWRRDGFHFANSN
jgi:hypothetical protein